MVGLQGNLEKNLIFVLNGTNKVMMLTSAGQRSFPIYILQNYRGSQSPIKGTGRSPSGEFAVHEEVCDKSSRNKRDAKLAAAPEC